MSVEIHTLTPAWAGYAFDLATEVFVSASTLHCAIGIELAPYRAYLWPSFEEILREGHSVCAIDETLGDLVGCLVATDYHRHLAGAPDPDAAFAAISAITHTLRQAYVAQRSIGPGEALLVDMAAVAPGYEGHGIYQRMRDAAHDAAAQHGFDTVIGELSSVSTQHVVLQRLGHRKLAEVKFAQFTFDGGYPFASIRTPESLVLAEGLL